MRQQSSNNGIGSGSKPAAAAAAAADVPLPASAKTGSQETAAAKSRKPHLQSRQDTPAKPRLRVIKAAQGNGPQQLVRGAAAVPADVAAQLDNVHGSRDSSWRQRATVPTTAGSWGVSTFSAWLELPTAQQVHLLPRSTMFHRPSAAAAAADLPVWRLATAAANCQCGGSSSGGASVAKASSARPAKVVHHQGYQGQDGAERLRVPQNSLPLLLGRQSAQLDEAQAVRDLQSRS
jgi:hypothetical protein